VAVESSGLLLFCFHADLLAGASLCTTAQPSFTRGGLVHGIFCICLYVQTWDLGARMFGSISFVVLALLLVHGDVERSGHLEVGAGLCASLLI